ncbi:tRNA (adenosine(37)-N6)-threonylcarbamoyltransferase complex ATPase subunit type 1 TsaE [soil metagenome]
MPDVWQLAGGGEVSQEQLGRVAKELLLAAGSQSVWLFFGEMGSGKTTLIKAIGTEKGVTDGMSSPTFSIINEYDAAGGKRIYHFDLYRIKNESELMEIGVNEYFYSNELCLIEWPEMLGSLTPSGCFYIRITPTGTDHRKIEFKLT